MKIINDWLTRSTQLYFNIQVLGQPSSLNVMSVRFSADSIVASTSTNIATTQQAALMNGQSNFNSMSSKMETQALMDTRQQHLGRLGTPDANNASYMSSDFNKNQQQQEQHLNSTSQTAPFGTNAQDLFSQLHEALALEPKYQPNLFLPLQSNVSFQIIFFYFFRFLLLLTIRRRWRYQPTFVVVVVNFKANNISLSNRETFYIIHSQDGGEITIGTRDGAAHVLRCLKVWYDLPNDVLFTAINLVDRFLTKMKVRPKHMACISVGSLHLAIKQLGLLPIDTDDLVAISQVSFRLVTDIANAQQNIYSGVKINC